MSSSNPSNALPVSTNGELISWTLSEIFVDPMITLEIYTTEGVKVSFPVARETLGRGYQYTPTHTVRNENGKPLQFTSAAIQAVRSLLTAKGEQSSIPGEMLPEVVRLCSELKTRSLIDACKEPFFEKLQRCHGVEEFFDFLNNHFLELESLEMGDVWREVAASFFENKMEFDIALERLSSLSAQLKTMTAASAKKRKQSCLHFVELAKFAFLTLARNLEGKPTFINSSDNLGELDTSRTKRSAQVDEPIAELWYDDEDRFGDFMACQARGKVMKETERNIQQTSLQVEKICSILLHSNSNLNLPEELYDVLTSFIQQLNELDYTETPCCALFNTLYAFHPWQIKDSDLESLLGRFQDYPVLVKLIEAKKHALKKEWVQEKNCHYAAYQLDSSCKLAKQGLEDYCTINQLDFSSLLQGVVLRKRPETREQGATGDQFITLNVKMDDGSVVAETYLCANLGVLSVYMPFIDSREVFDKKAVDIVRDIIQKQIHHNHKTILVTYGCSDDTFKDVIRLCCALDSELLKEVCRNYLKQQLKLDFTRATTQFFEFFGDLDFFSDWISHVTPNLKSNENRHTTLISLLEIVKSISKHSSLSAEGQSAIASLVEVAANSEAKLLVSDQVDFRRVEVMSAILIRGLPHLNYQHPLLGVMRSLSRKVEFGQAAQFPFTMALKIIYLRSPIPQKTCRIVCGLLRQYDECKALICFLEGRIHMLKEDYLKALQSFLEAQQYERASNVIHSQLAEVYLLLEEFERAEMGKRELLRVWREGNGKNGYVAERLGDLLRLQNQNRRAIEYYQLVLEIEPDNPDLVALVTECKFSSGEINDPEELIRVLRVQPNHVDSLVALSKIYYFQKRDSLSLEYCQKALNLQPENDAALTLRGMLYKKSGEYRRAIDCLTRAITVNPKNAEAIARRGSCYVKLNQERFKANAYADFDRAIALDLNNSYALKCRGYLFLQDNEIDKALEDMEAAHLLSPRNCSIIRKRGECYQKKKVYRRAIEDYAQFLKVRPNHVGVLEQKAFCHFKRGHQRSALQTVNIALRISPKKPSLLSLRGAIYSSLASDLDNLKYKDEYKERCKKGTEDCSSALKLDPSLADAYYWRSRNRYYCDSNNAGALEDINQALVLDPHHPDYLRHRAEYRWAQKDYQGAIEDANAALALNPGNGFPLTVKGRSLECLGDLEGAKRCQEIAIENDPKYGFAHRNLGIWYLNRKEHALAAKHLTDAYILLKGTYQLHDAVLLSKEHFELAKIEADPQKKREHLIYAKTLRCYAHSLRDNRWDKIRDASFLAECHFAMEDFIGAIKWADEKLSYWGFGSDVQALTIRARSYVATQEFDKARSDLKKLRGLVPADHDIATRLAQIEEALASGNIELAAHTSADAQNSLQELSKGGCQIL